MEWSPSDIALIISTTATALTAILGIGLPLFQDHQSKRHKHKEEQYNRIAQAMYFCVENSGMVVKVIDHNATRLPYLSAGIQTNPIDPLLQEIWDEFGRKRSLLRLMTSELGIDMVNFNVEIATVTASNLSFSLQDKKLIADPANDQVMKDRTEAEMRMIDEGANVLKAVRSKLGLPQL